MYFNRQHVKTCTVYTQDWSFIEKWLFSKNWPGCIVYVQANSMFITMEVNILGCYKCPMTQEIIGQDAFK